MDKHPLTLWRNANGKSLKDVAEAVNPPVTPSHISQIEHRLKGVSLDLGLQLEKLTGVPVEEFSRAKIEEDDHDEDEEEGEDRLPR